MVAEGILVDWGCVKKKPDGIVRLLLYGMSTCNFGFAT